MLRTGITMLFKHSTRPIVCLIYCVSSVVSRCFHTPLGEGYYVCYVVRSHGDTSLLPSLRNRGRPLVFFSSNGEAAGQKAADGVVIGLSVCVAVFVAALGGCIFCLGRSRAKRRGDTKKQARQVMKEQKT